MENCRSRGTQRTREEEWLHGRSARRRPRQRSKNTSKRCVAISPPPPWNPRPSWRFRVSDDNLLDIGVGYRRPFRRGPEGRARPVLIRRFPGQGVTSFGGGRATHGNFMYFTARMVQPASARTPAKVFKGAKRWPATWALPARHRRTSRSSRPMSSVASSRSAAPFPGTKVPGFWCATPWWRCPRMRKPAAFRASAEGS